MNKMIDRKVSWRTISVYKRTMLIVLAAITLVACGSKPVTEKTNSFKYAVTASQNINPDINGQPSSVVVRVYQLKNRVNFGNARYEDLFTPNKNTLGAEFIAVNEYLVDPGFNSQLDIDVSTATKFIGIAVGYRSIDTVNWRTIVEMPKKSKLDPIGLFSGRGIQIILDGLNVRAEKL